MNKNLIIDAFDSIGDELIDDYFKIAEKLKKQKAKKRNIIKFGSIAACFVLVICIGILLPIIKKEIDESGNDVGYAVWFGDFLYGPISVGDDAHYPEIRKLSYGATSELLYDIRDEHLGEYLGEIPAMKSLGLSPGKAYRFSAYPDSDAVMIVERDGKYTFYISSGNAVNQGKPTDSSSLFDIHGLPESAVSFSDREFNVIFTDNESLCELFSILSGKLPLDINDMEEIIWRDWCDSHGEGSVTFENGELYYKNAEVREEYVGFVNRNLHSFWVKTSKGFDELLLSIDFSYNNFSFCGNYYMLTDEEISRLLEILNIEINP